MVLKANELVFVKFERSVKEMCCRMTSATPCLTKCWYQLISSFCGTGQPLNYNKASSAVFLDSCVKETQ